MRGALLFSLGIAVGTIAVQPGAAQTDRIVALNHVGIAVKDVEDAMKFFTRTMGFKEAFTFRSPDGKPTFTYIQISRDTFVELLAAGPNRPAGLNHLGLEVTSVPAAIARLRQEGVKMDDARGGPNGPTKAWISNAVGPDGVTIELLEFGPDSLQRKAIDSFK